MVTSIAIRNRRNRLKLPKNAKLKTETITITAYNSHRPINTSPFTSRKFATSNMPGSTYPSI